jgi:hypothetical protein
METIDKEKEIIYEAVEYYIDGLRIDSNSLTEHYEGATEGTGLDYDDLIHPSGYSVSDMLEEIDENWRDNSTELYNYENECYAKLLAEICEEKIGGSWDYYFDRNETAPQSMTPGAWVIEREEDDCDEEDEEDD